MLDIRDQTGKLRQLDLLNIKPLFSNTLNKIKTCLLKQMTEMVFVSSAGDHRIDI